MTTRSDRLATQAEIDPRALEQSPEDFASQWRLIWVAFRRHRLAMTGAIIVLLFYFVGAFAEILAPFDPNSTSSSDIYHPPQMIHFIDRQEDGSWSLNPHVRALTVERDPFTLQITYNEDPGRKIYLDFFGKGDPYRLWGVIPMERRLLTTENPEERFYL